MPLQTVACLGIVLTVESKKVQCGPRTIYGCFPSLLGFGVRGQSHSNFLAFAVTGFDLDLQSTAGIHLEAVMTFAVQQATTLLERLISCSG